MRGMLEEFEKDNISVIKKNGQKHEGLKASVQKGRIFLSDSSVFIEPRDHIVRHMSNGGTETYEVIDPGFFEAMMDFEAHYQMTVKRLGEVDAEKVAQSVIYNFHGDNARVNNHSVDNSYNAVSHSSKVTQYITELKTEIEKLDLPISDRQDALEVVEELKTQLQAPTPKRSIVKSLLAALPAVEAIASIGSSIIAMLGS